MKWIKRAVVSTVVVVVILFGIGLALPREYSATSRIMLTVPRDTVWATLRNFGEYPRWDSDFRSSVKGESINGHEVWVQDVGGMTMTVKFNEVRAPRRLVTEIVTDEKSAWGGIWTYELKDNGSGTEVTITEDGWVKNPLLRVMLKTRGTHATMDALLKHLGVKFGEQVTPEHVK